VNTVNATPQGGNDARAAEITALLVEASSTDAIDHERVRKVIHQLAEAELNILFIYPGSKVPADMRKPQKRSADDRKAREAARDAGRRDWAKVRSPAGLALATTDTALLDDYLDNYIRVFSTWRTADGSKVKWSKKAEDAGEIVMVEPVAVNLAVEISDQSLCRGSKARHTTTRTCDLT
jgi:hypothetical protein